MICVAAMCLVKMLSLDILPLDFSHCQSSSSQGQFSLQFTAASSVHLGGVCASVAGGTDDFAIVTAVS